MAADDAGEGQDPRLKDAAPRERELHETLRERLEAIIPDLVRRTVSAGMGAVGATEDGLRRLSRDLQLPSVAGYLADTADTTKDKVLEIVAREVREFLAHVNLSDEIARMLTTLSFEIKTEIRFIPNSERYTGVDPDVKAAVRIKRAEGRDGKEPRPEGADRGDRAGHGDRPEGRSEARAEPRDPDQRDAGHREAREPRTGGDGRRSLGRLRRLWRRATDPLDLIPDDDEPTS
jgi:hypothetical protein